MSASMPLTRSLSAGASIGVKLTMRVIAETFEALPFSPNNVPEEEYIEQESYTHSGYGILLNGDAPSALIEEGLSSRRRISVSRPRPPSQRRLSDAYNPSPTLLPEAKLFSFSSEAKETISPLKPRTDYAMRAAMMRRRRMTIS